MALFKIDPGLAIWTWITFGVLLVLLQRYVFPSLLRNIRNREATIARSVDNAMKIERRLQEIEEERAEAVRRSRAEAEEILHRTREKAEALRQELLEQAEREAEDVLVRARATIEEERAAAVDSIRTELAKFACDTAETIIGRSFTSNEDREWSKELVNTI